VELTTAHQLIYSDTLIIQGHLSNHGKIDFTQCQINAYVYPKTDAGFMGFMQTLKPLRQTSISLDEPPTQNEQVSFELIWENMRLGEDQNLSVKGECY
jgi:hypothetical protein